MASAQNVVADWMGDGGERHNLASSRKSLVVRWLNEAQLRFADISECLRGVWTPTLDADGTAALPDDFLREIDGKVKWDAETLLEKADYPTMQIASLGATCAYAIWGGSFYVFDAAAGEPTIPYIKKPLEITERQLATASLEIPTEYHHDLIFFLDAMYARRNNDMPGYVAFLKQFNEVARMAHFKYGTRNDGPVRLPGSWY